MNSFQFRKGNYFLCNSVQQINNSHLELLQMSNGDCQPDIKPIPLSDDWLTTFGFKKVKGNWRSDNASFSLQVFGRGKFFLNTYSTTMEVCWIHQLQNLYFQVCREELYIKQKAW
jgi:hypothetical protein